ncbi:MAG: hypothetical protein KDI50_09780, partial [Candidatus Competibacteraceae bacterium]|nr:hypothetical protein [Candidatus Competibacteraceae bacterium]
MTGWRWLAEGAVGGRDFSLRQGGGVRWLVALEMTTTVGRFLAVAGWRCWVVDGARNDRGGVAVTVESRAYRPDDEGFLRRMHYEAVYWGPGRPSFAEAAGRPGFFWQIEGWGERAGDTALIGWVGEGPVGAAWYRFWPGAAEAPAGFIDT